MSQQRRRFKASVNLEDRIAEEAKLLGASAEKFACFITDVQGLSYATVRICACSEN
jgi:hypothetical protein